MGRGGGGGAGEMNSMTTTNDICDDQWAPGLATNKQMLTDAAVIGPGVCYSFSRTQV